MLQVANMLNAAGISAVSGVSDTSLGEGDGVLRIKGRNREHIFLLSEEFLDNLPCNGEFYRNWMGECPS